MKNQNVIITNPNLTCLFKGQIISKTSLPKMLEENFVTANEIEFVPYTKKLHLSMLQNTLSSYTHLTKKDVLKVY